MEGVVVDIAVIFDIWSRGMLEHAGIEVKQHLLDTPIPLELL